MDALHMVPSTPIDSLKNDEQEEERGYNVVRGFMGSHISHLSCRGGLRRNVNEWDGLPLSSFLHTELLTSACPVSLSSGFDAINLSARYVEILKAKNNALKNSRKKGSEKGKQKRDLLGTNGLVQLECANGSSALGADSTRAIDDGLGKPSSAVGSMVALPELNCCQISCGETNNIIIDGSSIPETMTSVLDARNILEDLVSLLPKNLSSGDHAFLSENGLQILSEESQNVHSRSIYYSDTSYHPLVKSNDSYYSMMKSDYAHYSEVNDSLVLDSISLDSSCDESPTDDHDLEQFGERSDDIFTSESPLLTVETKNSFPGGKSNGVIESNYHAGRKSFGRQTTTGYRNSHAFQRREKNSAVPKNPNVYKGHDFGTMNSLCRKENNRCIWQKVRKNNADECKHNSERINSADSHFDRNSKEALRHKKHCNNSDSYVPTLSEDKNETKFKVSRKLRRKKSLGKKQDGDSYFGKGFVSTEVFSNVCLKNGIQRSAILDSEARTDKLKDADTFSCSHSRTRHQRNGFRRKNPQFVTSGHARSSETYLGCLEGSDNTCSALPSLGKQNVRSQLNLLMESCILLDPAELHKGLSAVSVNALLDDQSAQKDKEVQPADQVKKYAAHRAIPQKPMSIGLKNSPIPGLAQPRVSGRICDDLAAESGTVEMTAANQLASNFGTSFSSGKTKAISATLESDNVTCFLSEDESVPKLNDECTCVTENCDNNHAASQLCLKHGNRNENVSSVENILSDLWAVNDSHRAQLASEMIEKATGSPTAMFERVLHSASPVICPLDNATRCQACMHGQAVDASLCRHEIPNISLASLWKWYKKHGSYGLEVRADDYENPKRLGIDRFAFRAYFVPFLSAVQLFKDSKSHAMSSKNLMLETMTVKEDDVNEASVSSSNIGLLPIFSMLVPQPRADSSSFSPSVNQVSDSELCSANTKNNQSDDSNLADMELLFEYFEYEQPQQRRPLFEMIKELVRGDVPSICRAYGDPSTLDTVGLHELHPNSWYSVAWYPIYRIPDGCFRAAFLTFHSLGHFIQRGSASVSGVKDSSCIVSPVVGLQSYNAQAECWFKPMHPAPCRTRDPLSINVPEVLRQRLKTLEHTASLMAQAVVKKGSQTYVNKQPDYEYFLSRRRW